MPEFLTNLDFIRVSMSCLNLNFSKVEHEKLTLFLTSGSGIYFERASVDGHPWPPTPSYHLPGNPDEESARELP